MTLLLLLAKSVWSLWCGFRWICCLFVCFFNALEKEKSVLHL